jgi:hypothetical protein
MSYLIKKSFASQGLQTEFKDMIQDEYFAINFYTFSSVVFTGTNK